MSSIRALLAPTRIIGCALTGGPAVLWLGTLNPRDLPAPPLPETVTGLKPAPASTKIQLPANVLTCAPGVFQPAPCSVRAGGTARLEVTRYLPAGKYTVLPVGAGPLRWWCN